MKISIYNPKQDDAVVPELCLRLIMAPYDKRVQVIAVDPETGVKLDAGVLIEFLADGRFKRAPAVIALGAGIQIDKEGKIIEKVYS